MEETNKDKSRFVQEGRFDCKRLARALPVTAQELRDGTSSPTTVATKLVLSDFWFLPKKENHDEKEDSCTALFVCLAQEVFDFATQEIDVLHAFIDDLMSHIDMPPLSIQEVKDIGLFAVFVGSIQQAFDKTLEMERWKSLLQVSTGLSLQENCHLYNMSNDQFLAYAMEKLSEKKFDTSQLLDTAYNESLFRKRLYIAIAAHNVADGLDLVESTCWECGSHPQVQRCSQCRVACYCSPECQKKSWKGGHKHTCKEMKGSFGRFMDDLELIDKATAAQDDTEATPITNPFRDYNVLQVLWKNILEGESNPLHVFKLHGCPEPSMATFYQNVQKLARRGSHWLFANQGNDTSDDLVAPTRLERLVVHGVPTLLCYDTSALENNPQDMARLCEHFRGYLRIDDIGTDITVKRFIQVYKSFDEFGEPFDDECDPKGMKCDCQASVVQRFKEKYNKHD